MEQLQVEKRDGTKEQYQTTKVRGSLMMAGASVEEAEDITTKISEWARANAKEGVVKTAAIRAKVIELLKETNTDAADSYEAYKKPSH